MDSMTMRPDEYRVMFEIEDNYWWYRGYRAMLKGILETLIPNPLPNLEGRMRILDAGCGTGANLQLLEEYGCAIGVDLSEAAIRFCRMRGGTLPERAMVASLLELPFPDSFFQFGVCISVICCIVDDVAAFREIARVLEPNARLIVQLPAYRFLWGAHDEAVQHKHRYSAREVREKMARAGLVVERVTYANTLLFPFEALARVLRRGRSADGEVHSDLFPLPRALNALLTALFVAEMRLVLRVNFPFGLSVLAVVRKGGNE